jgi:hypothetical protein
MQRRAGDNKVAQQVAKEFVNAGVANAVPLDENPLIPIDAGQRCIKACQDKRDASTIVCHNDYLNCISLSIPMDCLGIQNTCITNAGNAYTICIGLCP